MEGKAVFLASGVNLRLRLTPASRNKEQDKHLIDHVARSLRFKLFATCALWRCCFLPFAASFGGKISLSIQELDIREVMQMLSREQRMNIFVADGVSGDVSVNLYDMDTAEAVNLIAESAGFVVEQRGNSFFVIERDDAGKLRQSDRLEVRSFKVQYASTGRGRNDSGGIHFRVRQHQARCRKTICSWSRICRRFSTHGSAARRNRPRTESKS